MRALVLSLLVVLVAAPAAAGKGITDAVICGPERCAPAIDHTTFEAFEGGEPTEAPVRAAPFFQLRFNVMRGRGVHVDDEVPVTTLFLPGPGVVRAEDGTWRQLSGAVTRALRAKAFQIAPYPADRLDLRVRVLAAQMLGTPGPMDLVTPGAERTGADPAPVAPLVVGGVLALLAAAAGVALVTRRRRAPARS